MDATPTTPITHNYETSMIATNGIKLHVVQAGPADGEPLILLHGFPEFWYGWRRQIDFLAQRGYRVIVPDQRGYNLSDKPSEVDAYTTDKLAADIVGLLDALGHEQVYLAGHDWGAIVAWTLAELYPQRLKKLAILNVPHPRIFMQALSGGSIPQILKSWYIGFFQLPGLPENLISLNNYDLVLKGLQRTAKTGAFTDADLEQYRVAWSQPGAMTAMINWYRAAGRSASQQPAATRITTPTLILWGEKDFALEAVLAQRSAAICADATLIYFPDAGHFVQHEKPQAVNERLANFFSAPLTTSQEPTTI